MGAFSLGLFSSPIPPAPHAPATELTDRTALAILVQLYGRERAPILLAVAKTESALDPDARRVSESEDSRGAFQVNTKFWGAAAAPMGADAGATKLERFRAQAIAARPRKDDAFEAAAEPAFRRVGAGEGDAVNLVWQYGRYRARQIVSSITSWSADTVASSIALLKSAEGAAESSAAALAWRVRDQAYRTSHALAVETLSVIGGVLGGIAIGSVTVPLELLALFLLVAWLSSKRVRRATAVATKAVL